MTSFFGLNLACFTGLFFTGPFSVRHTPLTACSCNVRVPCVGYYFYPDRGACAPRSSALNCSPDVVDSCVHVLKQLAIRIFCPAQTNFILRGQSLLSFTHQPSTTHQSKLSITYPHNSQRYSLCFSRPSSSLPLLRQPAFTASPCSSVLRGLRLPSLVMVLPTVPSTGPLSLPRTRPAGPVKTSLPSTLVSPTLR